MDEIGDLGQAKNDILENIFLLSLPMNCSSTNCAVLLNTPVILKMSSCCVVHVSQLKKLARTKRTLQPTVKCRLAGRLGIGLPPLGRQIPTVVKSSSSSGFVESRAGSSDVGAGALSILGNRDDLDPFRFEVGLYLN